jgi:hypothetical protein
VTARKPLALGCTAVSVTAAAAASSGTLHRVATSTRVVEPAASRTLSPSLVSSRRHGLTATNLVDISPAATAGAAPRLTMTDAASIRPSNIWRLVPMSCQPNDALCRAFAPRSVASGAAPTTRQRVARIALKVSEGRMMARALTASGQK